MSGDRTEEGTEATREMRRLLALLRKESDRGLALVGASAIDEHLSRLLRGFFIEDKRAADALLSVDRPLGTFSSRIKLAYLLGLLEQAQYRELEAIRTIRNGCAHTIEDVDLGKPPHSDRIDALPAVKTTLGGINEAFGLSLTNHGGSHRNRLLVTVSFQCIWIWTKSISVVRLSTQDMTEFRTNALRDSASDFKIED